MIQGYSTGLDVAAGAMYPINNITLKKGCSVIQSAPATFQLNQRGIYLIHYDGYAAATVGGTVSTQLYVNGVAQPQAISSFVPAAVTDTRTFGFKSFVRVTQNNCNRNCFTSPTILQVINGETAVSDAHINICVTQIC